MTTIPSRSPSRPSVSRRVHAILGLRTKLWPWLTVLLAVSAPLAFANEPLYKKSFKDIINNYLFVGDFRLKAETRPIGDEVFWRYPVVVPKVEFPLSYEQGPNKEKEMEKSYPATPGEGIPLTHLNRGRALFVEGRIEEGKATWLSARARFGTTYPYHRRNDYFLGYAFLHLAMNEKHDKAQDWLVERTKQMMENSATFLSWAFQGKRDIPDAFLDTVAPRAYYNLAAIYYRYDRYPPSYGAANDGINFLRKTGRSDYRGGLRRVLAESFIKNRSYLEAVQELDTALRQDATKEDAAQIFARVGDIYFDLNNFELAEDAYALAIRVDQEAGGLHPGQFALRGESLFWLGRFSEAQKMFNYALSSAARANVREPMSDDLAAMASLRIADAWLARKDYAQARLAYFKHSNEFPRHRTRKFSDLRLACMELPEYEANNIEHARTLLAGLKGELAEKMAQEMAWACEVASYAQHERTESMLERVRAFSKLFPESRFLAALAQPVREFQAEKIEAFFKAEDYHGAINFFEGNRARLFQKPSDELKRSLYVAYAEVHRADAAQEFWSTYAKTATATPDLIREAMVAAELYKPNNKWRPISEGLAKTLYGRDLDLPHDLKIMVTIQRILSSDAAKIHRPWIYKLTKPWAKQDVARVCEFSYPQLTMMMQEPSPLMPVAAVKAEATALIDQYLNDLLKINTFCGYSLLEFEIEVFHNDPRALAARYLQREYLPIDGTTAKIIWSLAESLLEKGERDAATQLWQVLVTKGSNDIREVRYANARLSNKKTELEDLWQR